MATEDGPLRGLVRDERALTGIADELADRFAPLVSAATVERYLRRSYEAAGQDLRVGAHLLVTAERLAAAQLGALAQAAAQVSPAVVLHATQPSGRAQIAAAWFDHHAADRVRVRTAGPPPARALDASLLEILTRMRLHPDWADPAEPTSDLLDGADLVVPVDARIPLDGLPGRNRIYWRATDPVSAEDYYQTLSMTTELNIEVQALLTDLQGL